MKKIKTSKDEVLNKYPGSKCTKVTIVVENESRKVYEVTNAWGTRLGSGRYAKDAWDNASINL